MNATVISNYFGNGPDSGNMAFAGWMIIFISVIAVLVFIGIAVDEHIGYVLGAVIAASFVIVGINMCIKASELAENSKNQAISQLEHQGFTEINRDGESASFYARRNGQLVKCVAMSAGSGDKWDILCK